MCRLAVEYEGGIVHRGNCPTTIGEAYQIYNYNNINQLDNRSTWYIRPVGTLPWLYQLLAGCVVILHFAFVLFVVAGGLLALVRRGWVWVHIPAAVWGALIEFAGWICPLTPLEIRLREKAGLAAYSGGFIDQYIFPVLYPSGMNRNVQIALGILVLGLNTAVYGWILRRSARSRASS